MINLTYSIEPIAHQSVRAGRGKFYQPTRIMRYKKAIRAMTVRQLPNGFEMFSREVPLQMHVDYYFAYRSNEPKKNKTKPIPKITKPDVTDNLNKALVDSLAGVVFEQDQQIFDFRGEKYWASQEGIVIKINPYEADPA